MQKQELLINVTSAETRVALLENGRVEEILIERSSQLSYVGNIYLGKVVRVLPGMQSAFIDIGLERTAFLHVSDMYSQVKSENALTAPMTPIENMLFDGQVITVQAIKDPMGTKGARLSTKISIPGRLLVYLPYESGIGITQKVEDEIERQTLRQQMVELVGEDPKGGYIVRTAAINLGIEDWKNDIAYLSKLWEKIQQGRISHPAPYLLHKDLSLAQRALRDMVCDQTTAVVCDDDDVLVQLHEFAHSFMHAVISLINRAPLSRPLFDLYKIEEEINESLNHRVNLKSGGYLIIEQTEAMTTIDVNTGSYVSGRNFADTILKTNVEAAREIVHQTRLRNLGGILILDFIDMEDAKHHEHVIQILQTEFARDRSRINIQPFSALGLIEVTRKRTRESISRVLCEPCPMCKGRGSIKTTKTVCYEILREIHREACQFSASGFRVVAHPDVIDILLEEEAQHLARLSSQIGKPISLQAQAMFYQEQYDIVLL